MAKNPLVLRQEWLPIANVGSRDHSKIKGDLEMDAYQQVKDKLRKNLGIGFEVIGTPTCIHDWAGRFLHWRLRGVRAKSCLTNRRKKPILSPYHGRQETIGYGWFQKNKWANRIRMASAESPSRKNAITSWDSDISLWLVKHAEKDILVYFLIRPLCQRKSWPSIQIPMKKRSLLKPRLVPILVSIGFSYESTLP